MGAHSDRKKKRKEQAAEAARQENERISVPEHPLQIWFGAGLDAAQLFAVHDHSVCASKQPNRNSAGRKGGKVRIAQHSVGAVGTTTVQTSKQL